MPGGCRIGRRVLDGLTAAPGAVIAASHDRWLRRGWTGEELAPAA